MLLVGQERDAAHPATETNSAVWDPAWTLRTRGRLSRPESSRTAGGWWTGGLVELLHMRSGFPVSNLVIPRFQMENYCGATIVLVHWLLTSFCNNQLQSPDWVDLLASILRRKRNLVSDIMLVSSLFTQRNLLGKITLY